MKSRAFMNGSTRPKTLRGVWRLVFGAQEERQTPNAKRQTPALTWILLIALAISFFRAPLPAESATLAYMEDAISDPLAGASADHAIAFVTPTGVNAPTDTIVLTFQSFDLSLIGVGDIDFFHGTSTGYEHEAVLAASAGAGAWGVGIAGQAVTFTAPTDAGATEIAASSTVRLRIGTNASGGANRIVNPASAQNYTMTFSGVFGDSGSIGVAIVDNNQVSVTASYPTPPPPAEEDNNHGVPSDTTPPSIFNVQTTGVTETGAHMTWQTDELSTSALQYGNSMSYASGTTADASTVTSHAVDLAGLLSCSTYYFQVSSTDGSGNTGSAGGYSFSTACDTTPPVITDVRAGSITDTSAILLWTTNEPSTSAIDLGTTMAYGTHSADESLVTTHAVPVAGLLQNTTYHFSVASGDARGNSAVSADVTFQTLADTTPPANASLAATAGDAGIQLAWTNPSDADFAGVVIVRRTGAYPANPTDGTVVYNGSGTSFADNGLTNGTAYFYGAFAYDANGNFSSGSLASATPSAAVVEPPPVEPPPEEPPPAEPPPEEPPPSEPPSVTPPPTGPAEPSPVTPPIVVPTTPAEGVTSTPPTPSATIDIVFYAADRSLPLTMVGDAVGVRAGTTLLASVPLVSMNGTPSIVAFVLGNSTFNLAYDASANAYRGTVPIPSAPGTYTTKAQAVFTDGRVAEKEIDLVVQGSGRVIERGLVGGAQAIPGATVRLFKESGGTWEIWNGTAFGETNPISTDGNGYYAFDVPPGRYYAEIGKQGYETFATTPEFIDGNVFRANASLIRIPPAIAETIEKILTSDSSPTQKAGAIIKNVGENVSYEIKKFQQNVVESPAVQQATKTVVPPTAITVTAVNAASAFSAFNLLTYLQYLFTQPVLLFWRRKRKAYGTVYDSLSKRPIDLAIVRLVHVQSGLTVQTRVTDKHGRYIMTAKPGAYRIEVMKPSFFFPSAYLKGSASDVEFTDLYHGAEFTVKEDIQISYNIPIDPPAAEEVPRRILFKRALRSFQHAVALSGVLVSIAALLIAPSIWMGVFAAFQVAMYFLFRRLSLAKKPKKLGKVYDVLTNHPLSRAVVRIFDAKFNKLLETQITDSRGRYGFLVGKNVFYLMGEAKGYDQIKLPDLDLTKIDGGVVDREIPLMKKIGPNASGPQSESGKTASTAPTSFVSTVGKKK